MLLPPRLLPCCVNICRLLPLLRQHAAAAVRRCVSRLHRAAAPLLSLAASYSGCCCRRCSRLVALLLLCPPLLSPLLSLLLSAAAVAASPAAALSAGCSTGIALCCCFVRRCFVRRCSRLHRAAAVSAAAFSTLSLLGALPLLLSGCISISTSFVASVNKDSSTRIRSFVLLFK